MPRTGEKVKQPGVYSSRCCSYENALGENEEFPRCGGCSKPAEWIQVTPRR
jgi:hypothetical protein